MKIIKIYINRDIVLKKFQCPEKKIAACMIVRASPLMTKELHPQETCSKLCSKECCMGFTNGSGI
jgi:hypothetical protein